MDRHLMKMKSMDRTSVISLVALAAAAWAVCRIVMVCYACGMLYTFGIFYIGVLFGVYGICKKALFIKEAFFSVWIRVLLAFFFTSFQVYGMYLSVPGMDGRIGILELFLWALCLTPLTYGAQNMLFAWVLSRSAKAGGKKAEYGGHMAWKHFFAAHGVILSGFLIPFAAYYPAIMAYDVIPQLDQVKVSGYTTHHPLIHTLMLSMSLKIGEILPAVHNADRAGLAVYTVVQMLIVAGCFAYVYVFLLKKGVNRLLCYCFVLCAAFYPTHGMLAVSITKDTVYGVLVMVFTVFVWDMVTWDRNQDMGVKWLSAYLAVTVFLLLFRNNSIYAWLCYAAVASVVLYRGKGNDRKFFWKTAAVHVSALMLYALTSAGMAAAVHASNTTYAREMLSVPAQQIARVVAYHEEELDGQDIERLAEVWGEGNMPEYVPAIADRSKRDIPNDKEALRALAREWAELGVRYPGEYIRAFLLKNKGMWYLEDSTYLYDIYSYAKGYLQITYPSDQQEYMQALVPGYERHQKLQLLQSFYRYFAGGDALWKYLPPLALVMQPAFYCWLLFYYCVCCIGLGRGRLLLPAVYTLALAGTLLLAPCVLVRYLYPVMLAVTVLVLLGTASCRRDISGM